jgi:NADH:ubiquinone oxidoreductase subunit C
MKFLLKKSPQFSYLPILLQYSDFKEQILVINKSTLLFVLKNLKLHTSFQFNLLTCISGVDLLGLRYRFCVSYELLSVPFNSRIRVKLFLNEYTVNFSIFDIFINCVWWEREIWDLFGIFFENNPDLRRILTDYGFEGFPLRKDFPLSGFYGVYYSNLHKLIIEEPLSLSQEYRSFLVIN